MQRAESFISFLFLGVLLSIEIGTKIKLFFYFLCLNQIHFSFNFFLLTDRENVF
jgi:hypothetical protein